MMCLSRHTAAQVCIMLPHDPTGANGVKTPQPDFIKINDPPAFKKL